MSVFHERIRKLRKAHNYTLSEIAELLNVAEATAQRYETGRGIKSIPYETIEKYANIFNCTPQYLMGWDQDEIDAASEMQEDAAASRAQEETTLSHDLLTKEEFLKNLDDVNLTNEQWYILWRLIEEIVAANKKEGE